jgi:hypothetical protein
MLAEELAPAKAVLNLGFCLENDMSGDADGAGGTNVLLAAVLAALVIVVAVLGFLMFNDHGRGHWHDRAYDRGSMMPSH